MENDKSSLRDRADRLYDEGKIYQDNDEYEEAEQLFSQSAHIILDLEDSEVTPNSLLTLAEDIERLAEVADAQGEVDRARARYEKSAEIYQKLAANVKARGNSGFAQKLSERSMKLREKVIADRSADSHSHADDNDRKQLRREPAERPPTIEEESTTPFQEMLRVAVRPHVRDENQDVFRLKQDGYYDHPSGEGPLVSSSFSMGGWAYQQYGVAAGMQVRPHYGDNPLFFAFDEFPKNTWMSVQDNQGNPLPLEIYVEGGMGVYGKWLYPRRPPA